MNEEDAVIEIFGTISDAAALDALTLAAELDRLGTDWNVRSTEQEFLETIIDAQQAGAWVRFMKDDAGDLKHTRAACKEAGLSYIHSRSPSGEDYNVARYWTPGMDEEFSCDLDGINPLIPIARVREASANGAVQELLAEYDRNTLAHVEKAIRFTPEVIEALEASEIAP